MDNIQEQQFEVQFEAIKTMVKLMRQQKKKENDGQKCLMKQSIIQKHILIY